MPTPELARTHLRNVVEHVLQRPPKVGKAAADQLFKEVQSEYFPIDYKQALEILKRGPLARPKENLVREFLLGIMSTALKGDLTVSEVAKRFSAIKAVSELHREHFLKLVTTHFPKLLGKTPDAGLKFILPLITNIPEMQAAVDEGLKAKLLRCVEKAPAPDLNTVLTAALRIEVFKATATERIQNLDEDSVAIYMNSRRGKIPSEIIERALTLYSKSINFATANKKGQTLMLPAINSFTREQAIRLFDIADANGQVRYSAEFHELLRQIRALNLFPPEEFDSQITKREWTGDFADVMYTKPEKPISTEPPDEATAF
jgi:hypothetical protein